MCERLRTLLVRDAMNGGVRVCAVLAGASRVLVMLCRARCVRESRGAAAAVCVCSRSVVSAYASSSPRMGHWSSSACADGVRAYRVKWEVSATADGDDGDVRVHCDGLGSRLLLLLLLVVAVV